METILIKNGLICDGSGSAPMKIDVIVRNGRITRLGSFPKRDADLVIDATGMTVTPGCCQSAASCGAGWASMRSGSAPTTINRPPVAR